MKTVLELPQECYDAAHEKGAIELINVLINTPTLNTPVSEAITARQQGHFNKAVLLMSEANRDHVTALRKIQNQIDILNGHDQKEVVFSKYRQFPPFEIGIEQGEEILALLDRCSDDNSVQIRNSVHDSEMKIHALSEEYLFMKNRLGLDDSDESLLAINTEIEDLKESIRKDKERLLNCVYNEVIQLVPEMTVENVSHLIAICTNIVTVLLSPMATKQAYLVEVEQ